MILAILDYNCGTVDIVSNVPDMEHNCEVENYLVETLNYNLDEIYFMNIKTTDDVKFLTPEDFGH